ncbi:MAG: hypothetical protein D6798_03950 [Deltaproteobacteria bacterium]|nr:MAG: hypothetical protein D6798_03950 [Deltaproteobacteria bacterium]
MQLLLVGLVVAPTAARAEPGEHIGSDDAQLIPAVELGAQHRTNVYLQEGEAGGGAPTADGTNLFLTPSLGIRAQNSDLQFKLDVSYTARKYLQADVSNLDRFNIIDADAGLRLLPGGKVGLRFGDQFSITGYEAEDTAQVMESAYQQHLLNDLVGMVVIKPGGPLEVEAGGDLRIDHWSVPEQTKPSANPDDPGYDLLSSQPGPALNSRTSYGPVIDGKWRFFPKTAVVADFTYQWFDWKDNVVDATGDGISPEDLGDFLGIPDGRLWKARAGLRGRVTSHLVLGAEVGFGQAIYDPTSVSDQAAELGLADSSELDSSAGFDSALKAFPAGIIGQLDVDYELNDDHKVNLGYRRDFQDVYFTNYVDFDRLSASYGGRFVDRLGVDVSATYRYERYHGEVERNDHLIKTGLTGSWYFEEYLSASLGASWARRASADGAHPEIEYDDPRFTASMKFVY